MVTWVWLPEKFDIQLIFITLKVQGAKRQDILHPLFLPHQGTDPGGCVLFDAFFL
jgi:hypothetical protein